MRVSGFSWEGQTPSMGLRQGCPLNATLFGLFIDGLHHYLEVVAPVSPKVFAAQQPFKHSSDVHGISKPRPLIPSRYK